MQGKERILQIYRTFFTLTRNCPDRSLKLYIRRRAQEDFRAAAHETNPEVTAAFLKKAEGELVL